MLAFEIMINGEKVLAAGVEDWDLIHADIMARRAKEAIESDEYELSVGGLPQQIEDGKLEHIRWGRTELKLGDQITIRLIETDAADPPIRRYRSDRQVQEEPFTEEEILEMQKETYIELKKKFEGTDLG